MPREQRHAAKKLESDLVLDLETDTGQELVPSGEQKGTKKERAIGSHHRGKDVELLKTGDLVVLPTPDGRMQEYKVVEVKGEKIAVKEEGRRMGIARELTLEEARVGWENKQKILKAQKLTNAILRVLEKGFKIAFSPEEKRAIGEAVKTDVLADEVDSLIEKIEERFLRGKRGIKPKKEGVFSQQNLEEESAEDVHQRFFERTNFESSEAIEKVRKSRDYIMLAYWADAIREEDREAFWKVVHDLSQVREHSWDFYAHGSEMTAEKLRGLFQERVPFLSAFLKADAPSEEEVSVRMLNVRTDVDLGQAAEVFFEDGKERERRSPRSDLTLKDFLPPFLGAVFLEVETDPDIMNLENKLGLSEKGLSLVSKGDREETHDILRFSPEKGLQTVGKIFRIFGGDKRRYGIVSYDKKAFNPDFASFYQSKLEGTVLERSEPRKKRETSHVPKSLGVLENVPLFGEDFPELDVNKEDSESDLYAKTVEVNSKKEVEEELELGEPEEPTTIKADVSEVLRAARALQWERPIHQRENVSGVSSDISSTPKSGIWERTRSWLFGEKLSSPGVPVEVSEEKVSKEKDGVSVFDLRNPDLSIESKQEALAAATAWVAETIGEKGLEDVTLFGSYALHELTNYYQDSFFSDGKEGSSDFPGDMDAAIRKEKTFKEIYGKFQQLPNVSLDNGGEITSLKYDNTLRFGGTLEIPVRSGAKGGVLRLPFEFFYQKADTIVGERLQNRRMKVGNFYVLEPAALLEQYTNALRFDLKEAGRVRDQLNQQRPHLEEIIRKKEQTGFDPLAREEDLFGLSVQELKEFFKGEDRAELAHQAGQWYGEEGAEGLRKEQLRQLAAALGKKVEQRLQRMVKLIATSEARAESQRERRETPEGRKEGLHLANTQEGRDQIPEPSSDKEEYYGRMREANRQKEMEETLEGIRRKRERLLKEREQNQKASWFGRQFLRKWNAIWEASKVDVELRRLNDLEASLKNQETFLRASQKLKTVEETRKMDQQKNKAA